MRIKFECYADHETIPNYPNRAALYSLSTTLRKLIQFNQQRNQTKEYSWILTLNCT